MQLHEIVYVRDSILCEIKALSAEIADKQEKLDAQKKALAKLDSVDLYQPATDVMDGDTAWIPTISNFKQINPVTGTGVKSAAISKLNQM